MRLVTAASGTSLTQTAIFISSRDSNHGPEVRSPQAPARVLPFERDRPLLVSIRTTARALLLLALFGVAVGSAAAIPVDPGLHPPFPKPKPPKPKHARQIVFPVLGTVEFSDDYGAPRPQGPHQGIDILAPRHALALAAEAGSRPLLHRLGQGGLHALPRRQERDDVLLHPPEQRPHERERQPRRLQARESRSRKA